jgi:hypothetical protein
MPQTMHNTSQLRKHLFPFRPFQLNKRATAVPKFADKARSIASSSNFDQLFQLFQGMPPATK